MKSRYSRQRRRIWGFSGVAIVAGERDEQRAGGAILAGVLSFITVKEGGSAPCLTKFPLVSYIKLVSQLTLTIQVLELLLQLLEHLHHASLIIVVRINKQIFIGDFQQREDRQPSNSGTRHNT